MPAIASDPAFDWRQVDHALATLMLAEVSEEIRKGIEEDEQRIRAANRDNRNLLAAPLQRLQMHLRRADEWAQRTFDAYCDVWQRQGNALSPEFLRAVCANGIQPLIATRTSTVISALEMEAVRTRSYPDEWLKAACADFRREMQRLFARWNSRIEIEAKTAEHTRTLSNSQPGPDATVRDEISQARERLQHFGAEIAAIDTKISACQQALATMLSQGGAAVRAQSIERGIRKLNTAKKELELRRDDWLLNLRSAERRSQLRADRAPVHLVAMSVPDLRTGCTGRPEADSSFWHSLHREFVALANEEHNDLQAQAGDHCLRAYSDYKREKAAYGNWMLGEGPNENFRARFEALAARGGIALERATQDDPVVSWLHCLFLNLLEQKSKQLFAAEREVGGIILHVCEASATYCSRLEKDAVEREATDASGEVSRPISASQARARAVAKVIKELGVLRPRMFSDDDYDHLRQEYSRYMVFKVCGQHPDLKLKLESIQGHQQFKRFAKEIVAAHYSCKYSTIEKDWKTYNPNRKPRKRNPRLRSKRQIR